MLQRMYKRGIPREILYQAYFENYGIEPDADSPVPAWKEFIKILNKFYPGQGGTQLLLRFDKVDEIAVGLERIERMIK